MRIWFTSSNNRLAGKTKTVRLKLYWWLSATSIRSANGTERACMTWFRQLCRILHTQVWNPRILWFKLEPVRCMESTEFLNLLMLNTLRRLPTTFMSASGANTLRWRLKLLWRFLACLSIKLQLLICWDPRWEIFLRYISELWMKLTSKSW